MARRARGGGQERRLLEDSGIPGRPSAVGTVDGRWLLRGRDGRLTAYALGREGLLRWTEERPGGPEWTGPDLLPAPEVSRLSVAQGPDGYAHFVGRRERVRPSDGVPVVDIVHAVQYQTGRPLGPWHSAGNPYKDPEVGRRIGEPVAAVSGSGGLYVFLRNAGGGVTMRTDAPRGKWGLWKDIRGNKAQDGFAAVTGAEGRIELLAPGQGPAMRWWQTEPDGEMQRTPNIHLAAAPRSLTALETAPGSITYFWTDAAGGGLMAHRPGGWMIPLGGRAADGRIAALRALLDGYDCTVLAHRGPDGQVVVGVCGTEYEGAGMWWSPLGEHGTGDPALAVDAYGRVVLAWLGDDGRVRVARQKPEAGLAMERPVQL
ncbi:hypothetical protein [Streptomyces tritici]|uniref:hypothetical protein n=1 Tax=Streptomyces tritici TaxID=2054410 RepID=UPI003AF05806